MTKEEKKEYNKKYYAAHKEEQKIYFHLRYEKQKESYKENAKKWKSQNPERFKGYQDAYRLKNRESMIKYQTKRFQKTAYAQNHHKQWTSEEERFIISNHNILKLYDMAIKLNRSESAINRKLNRLRKEHRI